MSSEDVSSVLIASCLIMLVDASPRHCLISTCVQRHRILVKRLFDDVIVKYVDDVVKFLTLVMALIVAYTENRSVFAAVVGYTETR